MVNKRAWNAVLGCNLKNDRMISVRFQGKPFNHSNPRPGFDPWVWKIPWRRERLSISAFLPGEFHGQRSVAGYSPWGGKQSDVIEWLMLFFFFWWGISENIYCYDHNNGEQLGRIFMILLCLTSSLFKSESFLTKQVLIWIISKPELWLKINLKSGKLLLKSSYGRVSKLMSFYCILNFWCIFLTSWNC